MVDKSLVNLQERDRGGDRHSCQARIPGGVAEARGSQWCSGSEGNSETSQ